MSETIKVVVAGAGAFGRKHLDGIKNIDGVEVVSIVEPVPELARRVSEQYGIEHITGDLGEALEQPGVAAAILATPTQVHASQAIQCMDAGKHVEVEIPLADSLADAEAVVAKQKETGLVAMCGHTRRFNPSHQWIHNKIQAGELSIQQMDVQTFFFRPLKSECRGGAQILDRSFAVASRGTYD